MTKSWFREQILDKLIFGAMASLLAALVLFEFNSINDKLSHVQKSSDVEVAYLQSAFDGFSQNILNTLSLLTKKQREVLKVTAGEPELREPILDAGMNAEIYSEMFPISEAIGIKMRNCVKFYDGSLNYSNVHTLQTEELGNVIAELKTCHASSVAELVPFLRSKINANYIQSISENRIDVGLMKVDRSILVVSIFLFLLMLLVSVIYWRASE